MASDKLICTAKFVHVETQTDENIFSCIDAIVSSRTYLCLVCSRSCCFRCWDCGLAVYCSTTCMANDYNRHKIFCEEIRRNLSRATKAEILTDESSMVLAQADRDSYRKLWAGIILSLLSESMMSLCISGGSQNKLTLELAYYLTDALAATAPCLHKYIVSLLPKMLLMLGRNEESYNALKAMKLKAVRKPAKLISSDDALLPSSSFTMDEPIANIFSQSDVDLILVLDLALIKVLTANRIKEFHAFREHSLFANNILNLICSFLGCPMEVEPRKALVLERQAMELLKFVHENNRTILPSIVLRSRAMIISHPGPIAVKLSFQEWHRHGDAFNFLRSIAEDLCKFC